MVMIREPVVAGRFYPGSPEECEAAVARYGQCREADASLPMPCRGGIVPHAGWMCSGAVAGRVFAVLAQTATPRTVVLFGTMHRVHGRTGLLFAAGQWETPLGRVDVDERLAERVLGLTNHIVEDAAAHEDEHSLEVQVPFIQRLLPDCRILPILVPPVKEAPAIGDAVGRTLAEYAYEALVIGSTDLTHYGSSYRFTPKGTGAAALAWAKDVNDRRVIDLMTTMNADAMIEEVARNRNACGAGAIAATIAAVKRLGATRGILLEHTTSHEVLGERGFGDAVGYAGVLYA